MRFLSYNLRNACIREEAASSNWAYRRDAAVDLITKENPDVLALQEDSSEQLDDIRNALKESHNVCFDQAFYDADKAYNAIVVRKTLKVADAGAFWICGNGQTQSKIDGSICFRHATFVRLQKAHASLLAVNGHLDHTEDAAVKQAEMKTFIDLLSGIAGVPPTKTIVMGDFNNVPKMEPHFLLEKFGMRDAAQLQGSEDGTFSCWTRGSPSDRIDYIWLSDDLKSSLETYRVVLGAYPRQGGGFCYASDHAAVLAQFDI
ncbi:MAG TPA: endonuclease/exonuclease/phosphatase family protein [Pseudolabrys sp.]|nr:endonuclease/exonuclease/phosphatase family protein [Pseudolabrys sp.]